MKRNAISRISSLSMLAAASLAVMGLAAMADHKEGHNRGGGGGGGGETVPQFTAEFVPADDGNVAWGHPWLPLCPLVDSVSDPLYGGSPDCLSDVDEHSLILPDQILDNWSYVPLDPTDCMILFPSLNRDGTGVVTDPPFLNFKAGARLNPNSSANDLGVLFSMSHWVGQKSRRYHGAGPRLADPWNNNIEITPTGFILHVHRDAVGMTGGNGGHQGELAGYISLGDIVFTLVEPTP